MLLDRDKRAERVAGLVARAIAAELELQEKDLMEACRAVGKAVDALEQAGFSGRGEWAARQTLERAARKLRVLIRKKEGGA